MSDDIWNREVVRGLYQSDTNARELFDELARRQRNPSSTTVEQVVNMGATRPQAVQLLRALADAKCGTFRTGRRGHESRLEWDVPAVEVAKSVVQSLPSQSLPIPAASMNGDGFVEQR